MSNTLTETFGPVTTKPDRSAPSDASVKRKLLGLIRAVSIKAAHGLVNVTLEALEAARQLGSAAMTPILVLADRRMVLLYDLFCTQLPKAYESIRAVSSRYVVLSTRAWKKAHGGKVPAFVLLDDSKVHKSGGTLEKIRRKLDKFFGKIPDNGREFCCVDFSGYDLNPKILNEVCPRLSRQVSQSLAEHDIPRVTEHLRTTKMAITAGAFERLVQDPKVATIEVTNRGLGNTSCWSYTLVPRGKLREEMLAALGESKRFISAMNIRLFTHLVGNTVQIRFSPYLMANLPVSYLDRFLEKLGLDVDLDLSRDWGNDDAKDDNIAYSAEAEVHQLATFMLSRKMFSVVAEWAATALGADLQEDKEFSRLLLGEELDDLLHEHADIFLKDWDDKPDSDCPGAELPTDEDLRFGDEDLRSGVVGWDLAIKVVECIRENWDERKHTVTTARDLIDHLKVKNKEGEKVPDERANSEEKLSWILHCVTDGGYVSSVAAYDSAHKVWLPGWRTGESSSCTQDTPPGTGYAVYSQTRYSSSVINR